MIFFLYKTSQICCAIGASKFIVFFDIIIVSALSLNTFNVLDNLFSLSIIILIGLLPFQLLVVRLGLSSITVFVPTKIACSSALHLCTNCLEYSLVIQIGAFSFFDCGAIKPSVVCAHFKII